MRPNRKFQPHPTLSYRLQVIWLRDAMFLLHYILGKKEKKKEKELIICIHCVTDRSLPGAGLGDLWWGAL